MTINLANSGKSLINADFGVFGKTTQTLAAFKKVGTMIEYSITAIPVGAAKVILGTIYVATQALRALGELAFTAKEKRTAFTEVKFGLKNLIAAGLIQIIPVINAFAKLFQLEHAKKLKNETVKLMEYCAASTEDLVEKAKKVATSANGALLTDALRKANVIISDTKAKEGIASDVEANKLLEDSYRAIRIVDKAAVDLTELSQDADIPEAIMERKVRAFKELLKTL